MLPAVSVLWCLIECSRYGFFCFIIRTVVDNSSLFLSPDTLFIEVKWLIFWDSTSYNVPGHYFLGTLAKRRKKATSFVMPDVFRLSVRPSIRPFVFVRIEQLDYDWTHFREIWYWNILLNSVEIIYIWLKYDKKNGCVILSRSGLLRMRNISEKFIETIQPEVNVRLLSTENLAVYGIVWKNTVEPNRPQVAINYGACASHAGYLELHTHTRTHTNTHFENI